jgi:hypothetical protein
MGVKRSSALRARILIWVAPPPTQGYLFFARAKKGNRKKHAPETPTAPCASRLCRNGRATGHPCPGALPAGFRPRVPSGLRPKACDARAASTGERKNPFGRAVSGNVRPADPDSLPGPDGCSSAHPVWRARASQQERRKPEGRPAGVRPVARRHKGEPEMWAGTPRRACPGLSSEAGERSEESPVGRPYTREARGAGDFAPSGARFSW